MTNQSKECIKCKDENAFYRSRCSCECHQSKELMELRTKFDEAWNLTLAPNKGIVMEAVSSLLSLQKQEYEKRIDNLIDRGIELYKEGMEDVKQELVEKVEGLPDTYEGEESAVFRTTKSEVLELIKQL